MAKPRHKNSPVNAPWSALRRAGKAGIEGYVDAVGKWETIAEIAPSVHIDQRVAADFITRAIADYPVQRALIRELIASLELCLASEGLTWEAEHDAEIVVARARKIA